MVSQKQPSCCTTPAAMLDRPHVSPPATEAELLLRADALAGRPMRELASFAGTEPPLTLLRAKGWVGQLIEVLLGATAASRAEPDFPQLGVELKTLPVDERGRPVESTFVCTIELPEMDRAEWETSRLRKKLARVLWVPVEGTRAIPVGDRRLGTPFLWSPDQEESRALREDWEELSSLVGRGRTSELTAHRGVVLQVRPKGARGSSRRRVLDEDGGLYDEQPKGFYLRSTFTAEILARRLIVPSASVHGPVD